MNAPCKDCPKRVLGCHCTCAEYKAYSDTRQQTNKQRRVDGMFHDNPHRIKQSRRHMKKRGK
jgi:hypothetical protein